MTEPVDLAEVLAALEATSDELASHADRIAALEACNNELQQENERLRSELSQMIETVEKAKAVSASAAKDADQAEAEAATQKQRVGAIQGDLTAAVDKLSQIAAAAAKLRAHFEIKRQSK